MSLPWAALLAGVGVLAGGLGGLLGVGGGIILVPVLLWVLPRLGVASVDAGHYAVASSLVAVAATQMAGTWAHWREKNVMSRLVLWAGPAAAVAGWLGAAFAARLSGPWIARIFALLLLAVAAQFFFGGAAVRDVDACTEAGEGRRLSHALCAAGGAGAGFLGGLLGIGGSVVAIPYFHFVLGLGMRNAMGTALPVGFFGAALGIARHLLSHPSAPALEQSTGFVYWPAAASTSLGALLGSPLGAWLSARTGPSRLRRIFALVMVAVAARLLSN